jgi:hypothetical protein
MTDTYDPREPLELLTGAVEGYCDLETGECVASPPRADDKSGTADPPPVALRPIEGRRDDGKSPGPELSRL